MPYAVDAIVTHKSLQSLATPALRPAELKGAGEVCAAVVSLLKSVSATAAKGGKASDFISAKQDMIKATGLSDADVETMFEAVKLKQTIDALNARVAKGTLKLDDAVKKVAPADRLGLGAGSIKSYIRKPKNWGENRAGWQRKAVDGMAGNVGARIESICVSEKGTALAFPVNDLRLTKELDGASIPGKKENLKPIVKSVAQLNNPGEANYGTNVWGNYDRLFKD
jgi:hypothetical protein